MIMRVIYAIFLLMLSGLSGLLVYEHYTLKSELQRLVEIRDEYRTYTVTFRKILRDYQRLKDGDEQEGDEGNAELTGGEKKKEVVTEQFLVLNREPTYLTSSMISHLRRQRSGPSMLRQLREHGHVTASQGSSAAKIERSARVQKNRMRRRADRRRALVLAQLGAARKKIQGQRVRGLISDEPCVKDISFIWPVDRSTFWLSSFYGARRKPDRTWGFHHGIDLAACKGTPVKAAAAGVVTEAWYHKGFGNTIVIRHNNKYSTRYAHLHRMYVKVGQQVDQGQRIGAVGDTGNVRKRGRFASHLHLEVTAHGKRVNPLYFFV